MKITKNKRIIISSFICLIILSVSFIVYRTNFGASKSNNVDIKKYALDNTGTTDCSAGFQKMLDSYPTGSTIRIPKGKYKFSSTVKLKDGLKLTAQKDVVIIGTGKNTLINSGNADSFEKIKFQNCSTALKVLSKTGVIVTNCDFTNNIDYAAIEFNDSHSCNVKDSYFSDIHKYGVLIQSGSSKIAIDHNNFDNEKLFGGYKDAQISGHVYCLNGTNITVSNNTLKNSGGQGVIFAYNSSTGKGTTDSVASNNLCIGNGQEGATIYGGDQKVSSNNSLIGNTCKDNRFNQIEVWQTKNCFVKGNTVEESSAKFGNLGAICLYATTNTTCTSNIVMSAKNNGIDITAGSYKCLVSGNKVSNTNLMKNINTPEKGNAILLDTNGKVQPQYITITTNTISSSIGAINKTGINSTSNTNGHNKIDSNRITGYKHKISDNALKTCD